jgi:hypothetical protein
MIKLPWKKKSKQKNREGVSKLKYYHFKMRWLYCCLIFCVASCTQQKKTTIEKTNQLNIEKESANILKILAAKKIISNADLIVRTGNDYTSKNLKAFQKRDQTFSHIGIASIENDTLFVYHIVGGEFNPNQKLLRDVFENFVNPNENNEFGIFRSNISVEQKENTLAIAKKLYAAELIFDLKFDLKTTNKMYCSEFISYCFENGTKEEIKFNHSFIHTFEFIGVDDILLHPTNYKVLHFNYQLY